MLDLLLGAVALWAAGIAYLLPSLIAASRNRRVLPRLLVRNALLGWTVVVWVACLWIACMPRRPVSAPLRRDQVPDWLRSMPRDERGWHALPVATAPIFDGWRQ